MPRRRECSFAKVRDTRYGLMSLPACLRVRIPCESWTLIIGFSFLLGRAEERVAKLVDSPDKPESEASYKLDEGGWADV